MSSVSKNEENNINSGGTSTDQWPTVTEAYELKEVIGEGATATVNSAICLTRSNEQCAIKRINLEKVSVSLDELTKEIKAMSQCSHCNVVSYYTSFVAKSELWLVMKLMKGGSLLDIIKYRLEHEDCSKGVFDENTIATVMKDVLRGLDYFHQNNQIHRDVKAGNILISQDGTVQIADFGVAAFLQNEANDRGNDRRHTFVGTPCFMAPEVMEQVHGYNAKADIWSFGITLIELATGHAPYYKMPPMKVLMMALSNDPPTLDTNAEFKDQYKHYSRTFRKLISDCLQKDPNKRPNSAELLKHPFFRKAKDKKYIVETLIESGPGMTIRPDQEDASLETLHVKESKNSKHGSGRFYRTKSGEWNFSSDEGEDYTEYFAARAASQISNDECDNEASKPGAADVGANQSNAPTAQVSKGENANQAVAAPVPAVADPNAAAPIVNNVKLSFVLRVRNVARELNDIRFEFIIGQDCSDGVSSELVSAGLINGQDRIVIAAHLSKITDAYMKKSEPCVKESVFSLPSGLLPGEIPDENALLGFAQLTMVQD